MHMVSKMPQGAVSTCAIETRWGGKTLRHGSMGQDGNRKGETSSSESLGKRPGQHKSVKDRARDWGKACSLPSLRQNDQSLTKVPQGSTYSFIPSFVFMLSLCSSHICPQPCKSKHSAGHGPRAALVADMQIGTMRFCLGTLVFLGLEKVPGCLWPRDWADFT